MKRLNRSRGFWLRLLSALVCLAAGVGLFGAGKLVQRGLPDQNAAQRWQAGDLRYAQVSAFLSISASLTATDVRIVQNGIDTALATESLTAPEGARLWVQAYSAMTTATVTSGHASASVRAIATGGDYFLFHPLTMASGWYYSPDELMEDGILIDRSLAWTLFGSYELTDMPVYVGGWPCRVLGVVETPEGLEGDAYGDEPTLWLPWRLYVRLNAAAAATCYEALVPDPVSGYARGVVTEALNRNDNQCHVVENSARFGLENELTTFVSLNQQVQQTTDIQYPYWENAARVAQTRIGFLYAGAILLLVWPVGLALFTGLRWLIRGKRFLELKWEERKR